MTVVVAALQSKRAFRVVEIGLVILILLATGPITWTHYLIWMYVGVALLFDQASLEAMPGKTRVAVLVLSALAMGLASLRLMPVDEEWLAVVAANHWKLLYQYVTLASILTMGSAFCLSIAQGPRSEAAMRWPPVLSATV